MDSNEEWHDVVAFIKQENPALAALLQAVVFERVDEQTIRLRVRYQMHFEMLTKRSAMIEAAAASVCGPTTVEFVPYQIPEFEDRSDLPFKTPTDRLRMVLKGWSPSETECVGNREDALFCFYCGYLLDDTEVANHQGPACRRCRQEWPRLFSFNCISCDSGAWVHMHGVHQISMLNDYRVSQAVGYGACECGIGQLYKWDLNSGNPTIMFQGFDQFFQSASATFAVKDAVLPDS